MSFGLLFFLHFGEQECYTMAFNSRWSYRRFRFSGFDDFGYPVIHLEFCGFELLNRGVWIQGNIPF